MRTTLELPDPLFKHLKARAALEGSTLRDLIIGLIERGMKVAEPEAESNSLPSIRLNAPMALSTDKFTNAELSEMLYSISQKLKQ
ncbi:MAG: hypothetical protein RI918_2153 [Pseudomonadota bacterium]|jgi:hypothetical protein